MTWEQALVLAARDRKRVRLSTGQIGTLVYAPGDGSQRPHPKLRHGDPSKCGVRFSWLKRDTIIAIHPSDIVEVLDD
jgi:hypothetical protein